MYSETIAASKEKKKPTRKRTILSDLNMLESSCEVHSKPRHYNNSSSSDSSECEDEPVVKRQRKTTRRVIDPTQILSSDHSQSNVYTTIAKKSFEELHSSAFDFSKYYHPESDKINTEKQKSTHLRKNSELQDCNDNDVVCIDSSCGTPEPQDNLSGLSQSPAPPSPPPPVLTKPTRTRSFTKITKNLNKIQSSIQKLDQVLNCNSEDCQTLDNSVIIVDDDDDGDDDDRTIDSSLDNLSREIVVMVKIGSEIIRFSMNKMDMFCNLFSFLSKEKKVSENRLMLLLNEKTIHQNETPASIQLQVADIINCLITQESDDEDEDEEQVFSERTGPNVISLVIQNSINQKSKKIMKIGKFEPLQGIIDLYAKQHNLQAADLKLRFDGELINSSQTATDLDMEDEDCIDLIMI